MLQRALPEAPQQTPGGGSLARCCILAQEFTGDLGFCAALDLHRRIHRAHLLTVDASRQRIQQSAQGRRVVVGFGSIQQHRVVAREISAIILQRPQIVVGDLGVRGVEVDHVDVAGFDRAIGQIVIHAAHLPCIQLVACAQSGPAIAAVHEFVRKSETQPGMRAQIAEPCDPERFRLLAAHAQSVAVVEPQRLGKTDAERCQPGGQCLAIETLGVRQQFLGQCARVFGIQIDAAVLQRPPQDRAAAECRSVLHGQAQRPRLLLHEFTQNHRFREILGSHLQRGLLRLRDQADAQGQQGRQQ